MRVVPNERVSNTMYADRARLTDPNRKRTTSPRAPDADPSPGGMREAIKSGAPQALAVLGLSEKIPEMI